MVAANSVKITSNTDSMVAAVYVQEEVILAAGELFNPNLLILFGVGPKGLLSVANIKVKKDLAAVGSD